MSIRILEGVPIRFEDAELNFHIKNTKVLPVPYYIQHQTNWCWAACCEMIFSYYGITNIKQCHMASTQFGKDCCSDPSGDECNQPNFPEYTYDYYGFKYLHTLSELEFTAVQSEINLGRPVEVYYEWRKGGAHVALIIGYYSNGDLEVNDPWTGAGRRSYKYVLKAYGLGAWSATYSEIQRISHESA